MIMKLVILLVLSLLVSCGPSITPVEYKDSILNYKGGVIISKTVHIEYYTFRIRMYNKKINQYEIKIIHVCDGDNYRVGEVIK